MSLEGIDIQTNSFPIYELPKVKEEKPTKVTGETCFKAKAPPETTWEKTARIAHLIFSIIVIPYGLLRLTYRGLQLLAGRIVYPVQNKSFKRDLDYQVMKNSLVKDLKYEQIFFKTSDDCKIQGYLKKPLKSNGKIIVKFNGNGDFAENSLSTNKATLEKLSEEGYTILSFNHRNVGESDSRSPCQDDLIRDGEAALQYARDHLGFTEENMILWGHSLGGGISMQVAASHPNVNIVNDRSFRSLPKVVYNWNPFMKIGGVFLQLLGWTLNSEACWDKLKGKKVVVFCEADQLIRGDSQLRCSQKVREEERIQLDDFYGHCNPYDHSTVEQILERIFPLSISPEVQALIDAGSFEEALAMNLNSKEFKLCIYKLVENEEFDKACQKSRERFVDTVPAFVFYESIYDKLLVNDKEELAEKFRKYLN